MAFESILSVPFFLTLPFGGVKKLTCLWVAVLATTTLGRHVLNVFYLKDFVTWQVCEMLSDILFLRAGVFNFFSLFEKSPYRVGRHVLNVRPKKGVNLSTDR